jgi:hypothetical protein
LTDRKARIPEVRVVNLAPNCPFDRGDWKFVLIDTKDARHLVLGPISEFKYHAWLVKRFCEQTGVACLTLKKPDIVAILDKKAIVRGGGRMRYDRTVGTVSFFDSSRAYGSFSARDLSDILNRSELFAGMALRVDPS